ncbi:MAG TPA: riboflavin synthase [Actinomycetota bacterium]|nr:riboflavin synthase [Actinomycetota bacterium]
MFTGIVEERGRVVVMGHGGGAARIGVLAPTVSTGAEVGDSVAVNGVCLTVVERDGEALAFDLAAETLARTTLGDLRAGAHVNLERPLTLAARLGGHLVQGHVDGVGTVEAVEGDGRGATLWIRTPGDLERYVVEKGSVAVDGVSLTVAALRDGAFGVALVPHTLSVTTLGERRAGDRVNVEVDVLAKYVEQMTRRSG